MSYRLQQEDQEGYNSVSKWSVSRRKRRLGLEAVAE